MEAQVLQATTSNVPTTRTVYIGVWETTSGSIGVTGLPLEDKKVVEGHLMVSSRHSPGWKRIVSFDVPYFKEADNEV